MNLCCSVLIWNAAVRIEWSKSFARKERWREEVILLEEEMRRVLKSLEYETKAWELREAATGTARHVGEGMRAYARRQVVIRERLLERFSYLFSLEGRTVIGKRKKRGKGE